MDKRAKNILDLLRQVITSPVCELNYSNIYELLVAVVLSAQCTDRRVNKITPRLFQKYPNVSDLASANVCDIEDIIRSCGTYRVKAKNLVNMANQIVDNFGGEIPQTIEELTTLSGVGRKTASVVMAVGYSIPAMPVDTHILRVANRLGIVDSDDPRVVEEKLKTMFDRDYWIEIHHLILLFGRYHCKAIGYKCNDCKLNKICKKHLKND